MSRTACGPPPVLAYAVADTQSAPGYAMYTCTKGYTLRGGIGLRCNREGVWGPQPYPYCDDMVPLLSWWLAFLIAIAGITLVTLAWYILCMRVCKCGDKTCPGAHYKPKLPLATIDPVVWPARDLKAFDNFDTILPPEYQYAGYPDSAPAAYTTTPLHQYTAPVYTAQQVVEPYGLAPIPLDLAANSARSANYVLSDEDATPRAQLELRVASAHARQVQMPPAHVMPPRRKTDL